MVFPSARVVVFIDGDFWHGWRYPAWKERLGPFWQQKIERNRLRDVRNFRKLRNAGWNVLRIWEHEVNIDVEACVDRINDALRRGPLPKPKGAVVARRNTRLKKPLRRGKVGGQN